MQTVLLEINDNMKEIVWSVLQSLPRDAVKIIQYEDTTFTDDDELAYQIAMSEKNDSFSLEDLKERYGV
ncbi:MAG: hypothetical protein WAX77_14510 [Methylococcaceae bacterium]